MSDRLYTQELVDFLHALRAEALPADVLDRARYFLLDYLAVAIRGSTEGSARAVQRMVVKTGAAGNSTILGTAIRVIPALAALANGTSSHGVEQDDTHSGGSVHLGTTMYSVAFALVEANPAIRAGDFLAAVVAGFEASARIAMAVQPREHYSLGFHPTQTCGVFGAAITASKLLGLTAEQTRHAVGISGSMAAGSMEFLAEGAWTKRIHPGLAAQNGIQAAMLAAEGFLGPRRPLEGRDGFLHGYSRQPLPERLTAGLGESFEILRTAVKPHACCRYMQGPIDAILALVREHQITPNQIERIETAVLEAGWNIVCDPREKKYQPECVVDAQFSMPFGAAVAAVCGAAGLDQFTMEQIHNPEVQDVMRKVVLTRDAEIEKTFPREWPAHVVIQLKDIQLTNGQRLEKFIRHPKGDPANPLTWDEMVVKFRALAGPVLAPARCEEILAGVHGEDFAILPRLCASYDQSTGR